MVRSQAHFTSLIGGLAAIALLSTPALADGPAGPAISAGQTATVSLPPAQSGGLNELFTFAYPGDNSVVTIDAQINGVDNTNYGNIGFNVFDVENPTQPLETATTLNNQKNSIPGALEFNYSSGMPGTVTVQLFDWTPSQATVMITPVALPSGSVLLAGTPPNASVKVVGS